MGRARGVRERPEGLVYAPEFLTQDEERELLDRLGDVELGEVSMRGHTARRTVRHFGYDYDYESWRLAPTDALPAWLAWLRDRCAILADLEPSELAQTLVSRYPPGAGIGWHRDAPMFGAKVAGVSLRAPCRMRFQRTSGGTRRVFDLDLAPRSAYVLGGAARSAWQHSIPAVRELRYSITFRTVRKGGRVESAAGA